jgi:hypothetical protein
VILAIQVLPGPETLVETDYGRLLIAKVAFVAVAGSVAFVNRTRVVRAFQRGEDQSSLLRRLVAVEIGVLAVVFGLTATLTGQSPAGSGDSEAAVSAPYVSDQFLGPYHVVVTLAPRQVGTNTLTVDFHAISEEGETAPIAATATLTRADGTGEPVSESLGNTAGSRFVGEGIAIPAAGEWTLRLEVEVSEEETGTAEFRVGIER